MDYRSLMRVFSTAPLPVQQVVRRELRGGYSNADLYEIAKVGISVWKYLRRYQLCYKERFEDIDIPF